MSATSYPVIGYARATSEELLSIFELDECQKDGHLDHERLFDYITAHCGWKPTDSVGDSINLWGYFQNDVYPYVMPDGRRYIVHLDVLYPGDKYELGYEEDDCEGIDAGIELLCCEEDKDGFFMNGFSIEGKNVTVGYTTSVEAFSGRGGEVGFIRIAQADGQGLHCDHGILSDGDEREYLRNVAKRCIEKYGVETVSFIKSVNIPYTLFKGNSFSHSHRIAMNEKPIKEILLDAIDSLPCGVLPLRLGRPVRDTFGQEYDTLIRTGIQEGGRGTILWQETPTQGGENATLSLESLPPSVLASLLGEGTAAERASLLADYEKCSRDGKTLEWAEDAASLLSLSETADKYPPVKAACLFVLEYFYFCMRAFDWKMDPERLRLRIDASEHELPWIVGHDSFLAHTAERVSNIEMLEVCGEEDDTILLRVAASPVDGELPADTVLCLREEEFTVWHGDSCGPWSIPDESVLCLEAVVNSLCTGYPG